MTSDALAIYCSPRVIFRRAFAVLFLTALTATLDARAQGIAPTITSGGSSCLALHSDGSLWAWGVQYTNMPVNAVVSQLRPQPVPTPAAAAAGTAWTRIGAAGDHECALRSDGTLWAWGSNDAGQLGDGTRVAQFGAAVRIDAPGAPAGTTWTAVVPVGQVTLALRSDSSLWSWGKGLDGLLGDGTTSGARLVPAPVPVPGTAPRARWAQVAASNHHVLAVLSDGSLWAWGNNVNGQLGTAAPRGYLAVPARVLEPPGTGTGTRWVAVAAGNDHSLALRSDGSLWAWGENGHGQLGLGTTVRQVTPAPVPLPRTAAPNRVWGQIAAGEEHSLALLSDGTLWAWGSNAAAQLGDNTANDQSAPVQEFTRGTWTQLAGGGQHSLALAQGSNRVYATGAIAPQSNQGQLGDGTLNGALYFRACLATALPTTHPAVSDFGQAFPNPARDWVTLAGVALGTRVVIHNALGQQVGTAEVGTSGVDVRAFPPGIYWLVTQMARASPRFLRLIKE